MRARPLLLSLALVLSGCAGMTRAGEGPAASADLRDSTGATVGTAQLAASAGTVRVSVEARGLPPGAHGLHIHQVGSCQPPDFKSAGEHFNPEGKQHGTENPSGPHAGDLPNLEVGQDGTGRVETTTDRITLEEGPNSVLDGDGSAIVVHAKADDMKTDPSGNSGERIACGVVERSAGSGQRTGAGY